MANASVHTHTYTTHVHVRKHAHSIINYARFGHFRAAAGAGVGRLESVSKSSEASEDSAAMKYRFFIWWIV